MAFAQTVPASRRVTILGKLEFALDMALAAAGDWCEAVDKDERDDAMALEAELVDLLNRVEDLRAVWKLAAQTADDAAAMADYAADLRHMSSERAA